MSLAYICKTDNREQTIASCSPKAIKKQDSSSKQNDAATESTHTFIVHL